MKDKGFLLTGIKQECYGCEACVQACSHNALTMAEDSEGFRYPILDKNRCIDCNLCHKVCPAEKYPTKHPVPDTAFGGYNTDLSVRKESTSGGAFSAVVDAVCEDDNYVVFGAVSDGLSVRHAHIFDKAMLGCFRKSKYSQSIIGDSYRKTKDFLKSGKQVIFSGTPCQIAGLYRYLEVFKTDISALLTIEVICEGIPSPLYFRKFEQSVKNSRNACITEIDYRYKECGNSDFRKFKPGIKDQGKWDFQVMRVELSDGSIIKKDRWFNPFWRVWLNHLISRPSCYACPATTAARVADITLGDLWGVHIYCPELYGHNGGSSLVIANSKKGTEALEKAEHMMFGHELSMDDVLRYQGPMRGSIKANAMRDLCMADLRNPDIKFEKFNKKWAGRPSIGLLFNKYIWGNRQKVALYNLKKLL